MTLYYLTPLFRSPPTRAEWIEMRELAGENLVFRSPPTRAEWIEICNTERMITMKWSPPKRAEWIEMFGQGQFSRHW